MKSCDDGHDPDLLFVYGTLRRGSGHAMGDWLAAHADWRGAAACVAARLYRVSWYPALLPGRPEEVVLGDLYHLREPGRLWPVLDRFEGVAGRADDEYERRRSPLRLPEGGEGRAWVYWYRGGPEGLVRLPQGDWLAARG